VLCILQFQQILDAIGGAGETGIRLLPRERLVEGIVVYGNIGRNLLNVRIGAAKEHVLASPFDVVVLDSVGACAVPTGDGLGVLAYQLEVRNVGVIDPGLAACPAVVEAHTAHNAFAVIAVDAALVEDDVFGECTRRGLTAAAVANGYQ